MRTRNGTSRAVRVALCGRPVAVVRDGDWLPSWQHATCKDRGCPACAQTRSRRLARQIRAAVEHRRALGAAALAFVTLTQPRRPGELLRDCIARFERAWQRLRRLPEFHAVAGGVRVIEVTHSRKGWHVHAHCIVELHSTSRRVPCPTCNGAAVVASRREGRWCTKVCRSCSSSTQPGDGFMQEDCATIVRSWAALAECTREATAPDGSKCTVLSMSGQCAVPLDDANAGQLAKYLSKMWELEDEDCRELFVAFAGKRLVQTWGSWYRSVKMGPEKATGRQWYRGPFVADVERMHPRSYIDFHASAPVSFEPRTHQWCESTASCGRIPLGVEAVAPFVKGQRARKRGRLREQHENPNARTWRPTLELHRMTAGAFLRALRGDDRRADEHEQAPPDTPTPGADALRLSSTRDGPWAHHRRTGRWLLDASRRSRRDAS